MNIHTRIDPFRCRFDAPSLEREYQNFAFARNIATNKLGILFGVPLFSLYVILDFVNLSDPQSAVLIRILAALVAFAIFFALRFSEAARRHEWLTAGVVGILGAAMIVIIAREPSLDNAYYVGLIQAAVILSFLLRMNFEIAIATLLLMLIGFTLAVIGKEDTKESLLQILILVTMFSICGFGIYISERFRRLDFLKTQTIARQNEKLNVMLENVQLDNARKVAAMNLLVHFVKTPVHQIVGFTDVLGRALSDQGGTTTKECASSVDFIKSASRELSQNVNRLLAYYRLDEMTDQKIELVELDHLIRDYSEQFPADVCISTDCDKVAIKNYNAIICLALSGIVERYCDLGANVGRVAFSLKRSGDKAVITVHDDGQAISTDEFQKMARPLDKIDHYLTANGSSMPMMIRTIARVAQLCGGELTHSSATGQNIFALTLLDMKTEPAEAEAAA